jgi:DNA gyrase subunit A
METGHGSVKIRARYNIEGNKIIFYEIPYGETIEGLIAEVGKACEEKEIEGISDIHDESSKKIRIVVTCDKGVDPNIVVSKLYTKTNFQTTFSYNQVALINKTPTELNLKDAIKIYVEHNIECIIKECNFDLTKAKARLEIVNGLLKALEDIDNIIALIKSSENGAAAKENLIAKYNFTENQAKAILAMRLSSLAKLEAIELNKEAENLKEQISDLIKILTNRTEQVDVLKLRLNNLVLKYGDARRTELAQIEETKEEKEKPEVIPEDVVVIISHTDDIKRVPIKNFKVQHRKGVGVKTPDNAIKCIISTNTVDTLMLFSSTGKMYRLSVDKIPEGTNTSKGINLKTILPFDGNEEVQAATAASDSTRENVVFFTKNGLIKKTRFEEYSSMKKTTGIQAIKIKDGDKLVSVAFMDKEEVVLITKAGNSIKVPTDDIKAIGRLTSGVKGIGLKDGDEVISAFPITSEIDSVALISSNGKGKNIDLNTFIIQNRGGKGSPYMKLDTDDFLAAAAPVNKDSSLLIIGKPNSICIPVSELSNQTKAGAGTLVINGSKVLTAIRLS